MPRCLSEQLLAKEEPYPHTTNILTKQIDSLSASEDEIKGRLVNERLEYLVRTVEGEVHFEGLVEEICMNFKAHGEIMDLETREREWEIQRREVRFEEEIAMLKDSLQLEEELKVSHRERESAVQRKQEVDNIIWTAPLQVQGQRDKNEVGQHATEEGMQAKLIALSNEGWKTYADRPKNTEVLVFEDALKAANEHFENQRLEPMEIKQSQENVEQNFCEEQQCLVSQEKQLKSQVNLLEKDIVRLSTLSQEKDAIIAREIDRQEEYLADAENALDMLKEEKLLHSVTLGKLQKLESGLLGYKKKLSRVRDALRSHKDVGLVSSIEASLIDLDKDVSRTLLILSQEKNIYTTSHQLKLIEAWKTQRDTAIKERNTLEEKLSLLLKRARDREAEVEAMWAERETALLEKVHSLQGSLYHWEARYKTGEVELLHERKVWQDELGASQNHQVDGKLGLDGMGRGRIHWSKSQDKKLASAARATESESLSDRAVQRNILMPKRCLLDTKSSRDKVLGSDIKKETPVHDTSRMDRDQHSCADSSEIQENSSQGLLVMQDTVNREHKFQSCDNLQKSAMPVESKVGSLSRNVMIKEGKQEEEQSEFKHSIELLREERKELEEKLFENLLVMKDLKREITMKECKMEQERQQLEAAILEKATELQQIKAMLISKDYEMDTMQQKFRTEIQKIEEEVEKERKERQQVMDLHFASEKKLFNEMDLKEEKQEKEMYRLIQEIQRLKSDMDIRDEEYYKLFESLKNERRIWEMVGRNKNSQLAFTISKLMKENESLNQILNEKEYTGLESVESCVQRLETSQEKHFQWLGSCKDDISDHNEEAEQQPALGTLAVFQKQLAEAMVMIDQLKEDLRAKEMELLKARNEPESKWEKSGSAWSQEQHWKRKVWKDQHEWIQEHRQLEEIEQLETADIIALQGQVRELKWFLAQYEENAIRDTSIDSKKQELFRMSISNNEVVKVHTSHLEELDQYILELESRLNDSQKNLEAAEATILAQDLKNSAREESLDAALMEIEKEVLSISGNRDGHFFLPDSKHGMLVPHGQRTEHQKGCSDNHKVSKLDERRGTLRSILRNSFKPVNMIAQEHSPGPPEGYIDESIVLWDTEIEKRSILNADDTNERGSIGEEPWMIEESYCKGKLTLGFPSLPRHQQRWVVDAAWLERVRKEHAFIKHALMVEQKRTDSLAQVKEENKLLNALVVRAFQKKLECEQRATRFQDKVHLINRNVG